MHAPDTNIDRPLRPAGDVRGGQLALIVLALLVLAAIPVVTHPLPPLSDYINHLSTAHVVDAIDADPDLQRYYVIDWQLIPNLMIDLIVPVLHRFMSIYVAGQIFTLSIFTLILTGMLAFNRALFGRWSAAPLIAAPLLYNGVLLVGVMNYVFGIGLALWALAAWAALRERAWPWRFAASMLFAFALYVCHLFALGLYALGLLGYELQRLWAHRREPLRPRLFDFCATGLPFLLIGALLITSQTWDSQGVPAYWEFWGKIDGVMLAVGIYYDEVAYALLAVAALAGMLAAWRGILHFHPVGWALLGVGAIIYLAMPRALFAAHLADQRLPIALFFMLAACLTLDLPERHGRAAFAALLLLLLAVRVGEVQIVWDELARGPESAYASVKFIDRGSRVLVVHGDRSKTGLISDLGLLHAPSLATIERSALVTTNFTVKGKHILQTHDAYRSIVDTQDGIPPSIPYFLEAANGRSPYYFNDWPHHFDYIYILFTTPGEANPDPAHLKLVNEGVNLQLYRVLKPN